MHPPLRIDVPDDQHAASLRHHLQGFGVDTVAVDDHFEVHVDLINKTLTSE